MRRTLFSEEQDSYRESFRRFLAEQACPHYAEWESAGIVPRELYAKAAALGFAGMAIPERYGGAGIDDFRFNLVIGEEAALAQVGGFALGLTLHNDVCLPYLLTYANDEQRERWLPAIARGELILAIAMTEPGTGSDLAGIKTTAIRSGEHYLLNGAKTFITNGINADLIIVAVKTDPGERHRGVSLLLVERGMDGFARGRNLEKIGQHSQDTAELFFDSVQVPVANLLGDEGAGFGYLMSNLAQERLSIAIGALGAARAGLATTLEYVRGRLAFGQPIGAFQNTRFQMAECHAEIEVAQAYLDRCVEALGIRELTPEDAAVAKWWCTELQGRVLDRCVQMHGGYGFMAEYPIARAWADARATRIFGGTNEIMREIIGRSLGL
ncbi:MAG TPA: acyl-CoA dehydrogenase family protein [Solirubrobacteraceae bacterium]|nr:acyl-CoA dehydrogenase family protein [Solirubrobacteraceae bacterium]